MSNPRTKAERSAAKDTRQGITEQRPVSSKVKNRKYKYEVLCDLVFMNARMNQKAYRLGKFAKLSDAEKCAESAKRKRFYQNIRVRELE